MYYLLLSALAVMGVLVAAGAVIAVATRGLHIGKIQRLEHRKDVALARGRAISAEVETEMALHQLNLHREALMGVSNDGIALNPGAKLPEDYFQVAEEGEILGMKDASPKFQCEKCDATYIGMPSKEYCTHQDVTTGKQCFGRVRKIETAKLVKS